MESGHKVSERQAVPAVQTAVGTPRSLTCISVQPRCSVRQQQCSLPCAAATHASTPRSGSLPAALFLPGWHRCDSNEYTCLPRCAY
eukprot:5889002-Pyramimonas_sp.AAC.1